MQSKGIIMKSKICFMLIILMGMSGKFFAMEPDEYDYEAQDKLNLERFREEQASKSRKRCQEQERYKALLEELTEEELYEEKRRVEENDWERLQSIQDRLAELEGDAKAGAYIKGD